MPSCFEPIIGPQSEILILGTLPGPISLTRHEYYANPNNQFWDILYSVYGITVDNSYVEKKKFILTHKLALWDVLSSAIREGALDSNIKNAEPNDFRTFFARYPNIKYVIFNGSKAEEIFKRNYKALYKSMCCKRVSSSSPTVGRYVKTLSEKKSEWKIVINLFD